MELSSPSSASLSLAEAIAGAWRADPPPLSMRLEELERITPTLVRGRLGALVWNKIARSMPDWESRAIGVLHKDFIRQSFAARLHQLRIEKILEQLAARNIAVILFKGWDCARFYPPGLRPLGDIDLIVRESDFKRAGTAIAESPLAGRWADLGPHDLTYGDSRGLEELFDRSQEIAIGKSIVRVLGYEDRLRVLCTHMFKHQLCMPLWLCDIAAAVESLPSDFDWQRCLSGRPLVERQMSGALVLARNLLGAKVNHVPPRLVGGRVPQWALREAVADWTHRINLLTRQRIPAPIPVKPFVRALRHRWPRTSRVQLLIETGTTPSRASLAIRHFGGFVGRAVSFFWRSATGMR